MIIRNVLATTAILALAATPALAQQHGHGGAQAERAEHAGMMGQGEQMEQMHGDMMHGQMMGGGMMGMMQSMQPQPAMLLGASEALGLTPEQVERLTALQKSGQEAHQREMKAAMAAHKTANAALEGASPDLDAYAAALNAAAAHMVQAHVAMTRTAMDARAVLTPEQSRILEGAMSLMHTMQGHGMGGGMMEGGMKEGGMMGGGHH